MQGLLGEAWGLGGCPAALWAQLTLILPPHLEADRPPWALPWVSSSQGWPSRTGYFLARGLELRATSVSSVK